MARSVVVIRPPLYLHSYSRFVVGACVLKVALPIDIINNSELIPAHTARHALFLGSRFGPSDPCPDRAGYD
jgi:hypothetical protein